MTDVALGFAKGIAKALELDYKQKETQRKRNWEEGLIDKRLEDSIFTAEAGEAIKRNMEDEQNYLKFLNNPTSYMTTFYGQQAKALGLEGADAVKHVNKAMSSVTPAQVKAFGSRFAKRAIDVKGRKVGGAESLLQTTPESQPFTPLAVPKGKPVSVGPGSKLVRPETGEVVASAPFAPKEKPEVVQLQSEINALREQPPTPETTQQIQQLESRIQSLGVKPKEPSVFMQQQGRLAELDNILATETDPIQLQIARDQKTHILGNITEAADRIRTKALKSREQNVEDLGVLDIGMVNINRLLDLVTPEAGGPRALLTTLEDNLETYYSGLVGSDRSAANIFVEMDNVIAGTADPEQRKILEAQRKDMSNAYKNGTIGFLEGVIRFDIANALKRGQKLTADDLARVDEMLAGPLGSERYAAGLATAREQVAMRRETVIRRSAVARNIEFRSMRRVDDPETGMSVWYNPDQANKKWVRFNP